MTLEQAVNILELSQKNEYSIEEVKSKRDGLINIYAAHVNAKHHDEVTNQLRNKINSVHSVMVIKSHLDYIKEINEAAKCFYNTIVDYNPDLPVIYEIAKLSRKENDGSIQSPKANIPIITEFQTSNKNQNLVQNTKTVRPIEIIIFVWLLLLTIAMSLICAFIFQ